MARKFGVAALNKDPTAYADTKFVTVPTYDAPRAPTTLDVNYPIQTIWRERDPTDPTFFCEWILIGFDANGAQWRLLVCSTGPATMLSIETDDGAPNVIPNAMGEVQILGGAGIDVTGQGPGNTVTVALAGGGVAIDQIDVDFNTPPGTDPVLPDGAGQISIFGNTVTNATNANAPVATHSRAVNQFHVDVQLSTAVAPTPADPYDVGLSSFHTGQFNVDGNAFVSLKNPTGAAVGIWNLGFTLDSGTFSITAADGSALSASNPGYVTIWSREATNPGTLVTIPITANQSFDDATAGGGSEIANNLFGLTTGVAWASSMPFGVKAVLNDAEDTIQFMLSRNIFGMTTPAAANIGAPDDAVANAQNDYWSFDNIDETLYDGNPAMTIGTIYMTKSAGDDWTVSGLFASGSGSNYPRVFCVEALSNNFFSVAAHFGAATGTFLIDNGGTAPTFTSSFMRYQLDGPQSLRVWFQFNGNTATDGAGAVEARIAIPYSVKVNSAGLSCIIGSGRVVCPAYSGIVTFEAIGEEQYVRMRDINDNLIANQDFSDGTRLISGTILYRTGDNP